MSHPDPTYDPENSHDDEKADLQADDMTTEEQERELIALQEAKEKDQDV